MYVGFDEYICILNRLTGGYFARGGSDYGEVTTDKIMDPTTTPIMVTVVRVVPPPTTTMTHSYWVSSPS